MDGLGLLLAQNDHRGIVKILKETRAGKTTIICHACNPSKKMEFTSRSEAKYRLEKDHFKVRHEKNLASAGGPDLLRATLAVATKEVAHHCQGVVLYSDC